MKNDLSVKLGARIRKLRNKSRLTQQQLADLTGKSPEAISNLERGKSLPSVTTLDLLAGHLGVSLNDMFDFGKTPQSQSKAGLSAKISLLTKGDLELTHDFVELLLERRARR